MGLNALLRTKITIPFLLVLLTISLLTFFVSVDSVRGQSSDDRSWSVRSYVWNRRLNLWARTSCTLRIGGIKSETAGAQGEDLCSNSGTDDGLSHMRYYHDSDPDDPNSTDSSSYGQIRGNAWSPLYGLIKFDVSSFPSSSCYGLSGSARQTRIQKYDTVNVGTSDERSLVRLVGCAYVPLLRDYILFSSSGITDPSLPNNWRGVSVTVVEDDDSAYLSLNGCAWSGKSNFWSFGPNQDGLTEISESCLPEEHNTLLKEELPESRLGRDGNVRPTLNLQNSGARIGQEIQYTYECPDGYAEPELNLQFDANDESNKETVRTSAAGGVLRFFSGLYRKIFSRPIAGASLFCKDRSEIFRLSRSNDTSGIYIKDSLLILSFNVEPAAVTEGGFVQFGGAVSNQGSFTDRIDSSVDAAGKVIHGNYAYCTISDKITGNVIRSFDVDRLNVEIDAFDFVVRDSIYELRCFSKVFNSSGGYRWSATEPRVISVKVLPSRIIERNVSSNVGIPIITDQGSSVDVAIPDDVSEVYVHKLNKGVSETVGERNISGLDSVLNIFVRKGSARTGESDQSIKNRLFETDLHSKVSIISGKNGSVSKSSSPYKEVIVSEARNSNGQWSQKVVYNSFEHGECGATQNSCSSGTALLTIPDTQNVYYWRCTGSGGGFDSNICQIEQTPCVRDSSGYCTPTRGSCPAKTTSDNCVLALTPSGKYGGTCSVADGIGSCFYICNDGTWVSGGVNTCSSSSP